MKKKAIILLAFVTLFVIIPLFTVKAEEPEVTTIFNMQDYIRDLPVDNFANAGLLTPGSHLGTPWITAAGAGINLVSRSDTDRAFEIWGSGCYVEGVDVSLHASNGINIVFQAGSYYINPDANNVYTITVHIYGAYNTAIDVRRLDNLDVISTHTIPQTTVLTLQGTYAQLVENYGGGINIRSHDRIDYEENLHGSAFYLNNVIVTGIVTVIDIDDYSDIIITRPDEYLDPFLLNPASDPARSLFPNRLAGTRLDFGVWQFTGATRTVESINPISVVYGYEDIFNEMFEVTVSISDFSLASGESIFSSFQLELRTIDVGYYDKPIQGANDIIRADPPDSLRLLANQPVVAFNTNIIGHGFVTYQGVLTFTQERPALGRANAVITWKIGLEVDE